MELMLNKLTAIGVKLGNGSQEVYLEDGREYEIFQMWEYLEIHLDERIIYVSYLDVHKIFYDALPFRGIWEEDIIGLKSKDGENCTRNGFPIWQGMKDHGVQVC